MRETPARRPEPAVGREGTHTYTTARALSRQLRFCKVHNGCRRHHTDKYAHTRRSSMFRVRAVLGPSCSRAIVSRRNEPGLQLVRTTAAAHFSISAPAPEDAWDSAEHVQEEAYFKSLSQEQLVKNNRATHALQRKDLIKRLSKESNITHSDMYRILDWKITQDAKSAV